MNFRKSKSYWYTPKKIKIECTNNSDYICSLKLPEPKDEADQSSVDYPDIKYNPAYRDYFIIVLFTRCFYL